MKSKLRARRITTILLAVGALFLCFASSRASAADRLSSRTAVTPFQRAGVLGGENAYDDYNFRAPGSSALFATAAANFYQTSGRRAGEEECGGGEDTAAGTSAEDEDHAKELLCLQVLDEAGVVLCWAERPSQPGWQRDPRLACAIAGDPEVPASYTLRVSFNDGSCGDTSYPSSPVRKDGSPVAVPYLIDGSLRAIAGDGPLF